MQDAATGRRALFIVNRNSRQGAEQGDKARALLEAAGFTLHAAQCADAAALGDTIREHAASVDLVVLGGGDGTLSSAAKALIEAKRPLGILPLGTANDLARTLGIPFALEEAVAVIISGHTRRIDLGEVNGIPFFNVASLGLSVALTHELTHEVKQRWGRLGYAVATFRALAKMRPFSAELNRGGHVEQVRTMQISVGNGRYYGGGMAVEADADIDDGCLDLYSLEFERLWKLALIYPAFRGGRHGMWREVRAETCTEIEVRTKRPKPINTDGEITTQTPARFRILREALDVLAPPPGEKLEPDGTPMRDTAKAGA